MSRRVVAVAVAVSLLLVIVWWVGIRSPQSKAIKHAHADQAAAAQQVVSLRAQAVVLQGQKAGLPAITAELAALKLALPAKPALDQVIDAIHQASTAAGVELGNLSQGVATATATTAASTAGGLQVVNLGMTATGTYSELMDYLNKLNALARTMVVDSLSVGAGATAAEMSAQITGRMFYVSAGS
jgi:Tfp pilus assembly protein PilO